MADVTIASLPSATSATGAVVALEIAGTRYRVTLAQIITAVQTAKGA